MPHELTKKREESKASVWVGEKVSSPKEVRTRAESCEARVGVAFS